MRTSEWKESNEDRCVIRQMRSNDLNYPPLTTAARRILDDPRLKLIVDYFGNRIWLRLDSQIFQHPARHLGRVNQFQWRTYVAQVVAEALEFLAGHEAVEVLTSEDIEKGFSEFMRYMWNFCEGIHTITAHTPKSWYIEDRVYKNALQGMSNLLVWAEEAAEHPLGWLLDV